MGAAHLNSFMAPSKFPPSAPGAGQPCGSGFFQLTMSLCHKDGAATVPTHGTSVVGATCPFPASPSLRRRCLPNNEGASVRQNLPISHSGWV